ncbi:hypothetical protein KUV65_07365 [Maritalea mobilis]|uniref:Uncharacterized protein n=1 Tax=[Roseibacterium] beibuensis TaxID=1193142 RepID=A0ABP9KTC5_9RHOB|nr:MULTISPECIES: hypothetical protein [Alphaproteobacteria]MBY6201172.1 hypothetical protein [Maritalea mobilis]MCS6622198.1 hypothetical protein [Roseibacterium beibuensis]
MKTRRWMKTILEEAKKAEDVQMTWHRQVRTKRGIAAKPIRLKAAS